MQKTKKIVITGGHAATTALATIEELKRREVKDGWEIYFIGAQSAVEGRHVPTIETTVLPKMGVKHKTIISGRLQRRFTLWTIPSLVKIPFGFIHALYLLLFIRPEIILSFGGFSAFPVVLIGWLLRIPIVVHEQTIVVGRANMASSFFARKIAIAREESKGYYPKEKCVLTGNPIMSQIKEVNKKEKLSDTPTIFVTGGSRGSQTINENLEKIIPQLTSKYHLIHQTGHIDYEKYLNIKNSLDPKLVKNYDVYSVIDPMQMDNIYRQADLVVARAGANTVSEVLAIKIPTIFIPIPWTFLDEQTLNAKYAQKFGFTFDLPQASLTPEKLLGKIEEVIKNYNKIVSLIENAPSIDLAASEKLVDLLEGVVG